MDPYPYVKLHEMIRNDDESVGNPGKLSLLDGLEHDFCFSIYWECHHPNWRTHIFQRGRSTANQIIGNPIIIGKYSNDHDLPIWDNLSIGKLSLLDGKYSNWYNVRPPSYKLV